MGTREGDDEMGNRVNVNHVYRQKERLERELDRLLCQQDVAGFERTRREAIGFCAQLSSRIRPQLRGAGLGIARESSKTDLDLEGLNLSGLELDSVKFYGLNLDGLVMEDAEIRGAVRFIKCRLIKSTFKNVVNGQWGGAGRMIFMSSCLAQSQFSEIELTKKANKDTYEEHGGIGFRAGSNMRGCVFSRCTLNWLQIEDVLGFEGSRFSECIVERLSIGSRGVDDQKSLQDVESVGLKDALAPDYWARISGTESGL